MIQYLNLSQAETALVTLAVVGVMFILFVREVYPTEVVALSGVALMLVLGLLPYEDALPVLANPAPWTIAAMFIVMGALVRTGALDAFTQAAERNADRPKVAIASLLGFVIVASAIVANTPVVVVMIPVFVQLARKLKICLLYTSPSPRD